MRNALAIVRCVPFAIFLFVAITGAIVALVGGAVGSVEVLEFGKLAAGLGAVAFFGWLLLPALLSAL
ncbi:hypothetical protein [Bradyrhizobium cenepequi]